ncbi:MAG: ribosome-associated translation inhibitor RaiA [Planctomycetes bacterium]|nr:ribosome-associated translation inhibitor RaiA [Planctomycetota bacterium]
MKHIDITEEMKDYAEERAEKMARYFDRVNAVHVVLNRDGNLYSAEMICHGVRGKDLVCSERDKDVFAAMDLVTDKMERQLTKLKEKVRGHHVKENNKNGTPELPSSDQKELGEDWL